MIIKQATGVVERSGTQTERRFQIAATAKAFDILSSGLYSNKFNAIVRELSANAMDGHGAVGKTDVPFEIHLPSEKEPYFSVKDYGVGLSPENLETIYTTYFISDKAETNDAIGGQGLGAKSPLSYTDNFQVTSCFEGVRRIYTVYRDENGFPTLALMSEEPANGAVGVEVQFAVEKDDYWEFNDAVREVARYFPVLPKLVNPPKTKTKPWTSYSGEQQPTERYALEPPDYGLRTATVAMRSTGEKKQKAEGSSYTLVMGGIAYPIDTKQLGEIPGVLHGVIDFYAPVGTAQVAASREALSYTPETRESLNRLFQQGAIEVIDWVEQQIETSPTLWDARLRALSVSHWVRFSSGFTPRWRGRRAGPKLDFHGPLGPRLPYFGDKRDAVVELIGYRDWSSRRHRWGKPNITYKREAITDVYITHKLGVIFADGGERGKYAKIERWFDDHPTTKLGLIIPTQCLTEEFLAEAGFGHMIVRVADLPNAEIVRRPRATSFVRELWDSRWVDAHNIDLEKGGIYVETCRDSLYRRGESWQGKRLVDPSKISGIRREIAVVEGKERRNCPVYGVTTADLPRLLKKGPWVQFDAHVRAVLAEMAPKLARKYSLIRASRQVNAVEGIHHLFGKEWKFRKGSVFADYVRLAHETAHAHADPVMEAVQTLQTVYDDVAGLVPEPCQEYLDLTEKVFQTYPLLHDLDIYQEKAQRVKDYIDLVDRDLAMRAAKREAKRQATTKV